MASLAQMKREAEAQSMKALQDRREQTRQDFFKGREDITPSRLDRRQIQSDLYEKFKQEQMKPAGNTGVIDPVTGKLTGVLYQSRTPGGPTLADEANRLARMYGPSMKEIGSDIGYGIGSIGRGLGEFIGKGGVVGNLLSGIYDKFKSGTQQGIETVKGLYDNLRQNLSGKPNYTINRGGGSVISSVTETPMYDNVSNRGMNIPVSIAQPVAYSPTTPVNTGFSPEGYSYGIGSVPINNSGFYPEAFNNVGIENPLFNNRQYDPININNMDLSGVNNLQLAGVNSEQRKMLDQYLFNQMLNEEIQRNRQQKFDKEQQMYQTNPVGQQVLFAKDGGSVDKYAGLGYKLR